MNLDEVREREREWLAKHGLLDRPWFVLGAAPDPRIPAEITKHAALISINNAGIAAARMGLPPADLTFRNKNKEWDTLAGCEVPLVLWVCDRNPLQILWKRLTIRKAKLGEIRVMRRKHRQDMYRHMLRAGPDTSEDIRKPSTGVVAVLYGLFVGVPGIVLGGMSLDKKGYSYDSPRARMLHVDEDRFALERIAKVYSNVHTTEPIVAAETGIPLYEGPGLAPLGEAAQQRSYG